METTNESVVPVRSVSVFRETLHNVISSSVGAACCVYTGQPFDTIKVRMQLLSGEKTRTGISSIIRDTITQGGVRALWRGSTPALTGQLAENCVAFGINGLLKRLFDDNSKVEETNMQVFLKPILNGGITGFFASLVLCPSDLVKCKAQAQIARGGQSNVMKIVSNVVKRDGLKGLWRGYLTQVLRDIPFYASFFGSYDILCYLFRKSTEWSEATVYFISGGLAGQIGWVCSIVPDTIKSRIQASDAPLTLSGVYRDILRTQGVYGLFTGIEVAIIRAFPANAALFLGYEYAKKSLAAMHL